LPEVPASYEVTGSRPEPRALSGDADTKGTEQTDARAENESISSDRVTIRLAENGFIDVDRMRSSVKTRLKAAFSDPNLAAKLGLEPIASDAPSGGAERKLFTEQVAPAIFNALNSILTAVPRRFGYTAEQAAVMAFEPHEIDGMTPLAGKVLEKHLGGKSKYQDEYMLAAMIVMGILGKVTLLEKAASVHRLVPRTASEPAAEPLPS
jgi:hypothetical protein